MHDTEIREETSAASMCACAPFKSIERERPCALPVSNITQIVNHPRTTMAVSSLGAAGQQYDSTDLEVLWILRSIQKARWTSSGSTLNSNRFGWFVKLHQYFAMTRIWSMSFFVLTASMGHLRFSYCGTHWAHCRCRIFHISGIFREARWYDCLLSREYVCPL